MRQFLEGLVLCVLLAASAAAHAEWVYRDDSIMGTRVAVEVWAPDRLSGEVAINAVFSDMRRIDLLMSTYKPASEISRVNRERHSAPGAFRRTLLADPYVDPYSELSKGL